jgi:hypothetical protein
LAYIYVSYFVFSYINVGVSRDGWERGDDIEERCFPSVAKGLCYHGSVDFTVKELGCRLITVVNLCKELVDAL